MVLKRDNFWWEDRGCLVKEVQQKTVAPICQHDSAAASTTESASTTTAFSCPAGWEEYEGHCYLFVRSSTLSWSSAEANCVSYGGHLASIHSYSEESFLYSLMGSSYTITWLGASDRNQEVKIIPHFFYAAYVWNFFNRKKWFRQLYA
jgi:hypothetical protein